MGLILIAALSGALSAQPPSDPAEPVATEVCLTNACAPPLKLPAIARTVQEAIALGQAHKVRELGGTPVQALSAVETKIRARLAEPTHPEGLMDYVTDFQRFADVSDGSTLTFVSRATDTPDQLGLLVVGGIERRYPNGRIEVMQLMNNGAGRLGVDPSVGR